MRALFIHQNFPGQFRHVAVALAQRAGHQVLALTDAGNKQTLAGINIARYRTPPPAAEGMTRAAAFLANRFRRGEAVARALLELKRRGFAPDIVVGHPGWGELLLAKEVFPEAPLIVHAEYYYRAEGGDVGFDPEFPDLTDELRFGLKVKNVPLMAAVLDGRLAVAPTQWQASCFPAELAAKIKVIHEGIRTDLVRPDPQAQATLDGRTFRPGDELITFVNRNLEPMRGFHIFMRALPRILTARPAAHVAIVGGEGVSYGRPPGDGGSWKSKLLAEVGQGLPKERVHFLGQIPYQAFVSLMQATRLHIYATYPFVLSWSMLEAMSAGALVLASSTPPVTEMIEDGRNGLLYDFFDVEGLARRAIAALAEPEKHLELRQQARADVVRRFDLERQCLPEWLATIDAVTAKTGPA